MAMQRPGEDPVRYHKEPDVYKRQTLAIAQKYCDSLHYLNLLNKNKEYVYILEHPHGNRISRLRLRNRIKRICHFRCLNIWDLGQN